MSVVVLIVAYKYVGIKNGASYKLNFYGEKCCWSWGFVFVCETRHKGKKIRIDPSILIT